MEFLHRAVHIAFWRDLTRTLTVAGEVPPEVFEVACPDCGAPYFANPLRDIPPRAALAVRQAARASARARLSEQCPDHAHRFQVPLETAQ